MIQEITSKTVLVIAPAVVLKNVNATVVDIDTLDPLTGGVGKADYMTVNVMLGVNDSGLDILFLEASDVANTFGGTAYAGLDYTVAPLTVPATTDGSKIFQFHVDLRGKPRYWRLVAHIANVGTSSGICAWAVLSRLEQLPRGAASRGAAQEAFA